jgi:hypothetical protein
MKKIEPGPVGLNVARNVRRLREAAGYGYAELSRLLTDMGRPIPPLGIRHLEEGSRRVDVDELVMLATALQVAPMELLLPVNRPEWARGYFVHGIQGGMPQILIRASEQVRVAFTDGND